MSTEQHLMRNIAFLILKNASIIERISIILDSPKLNVHNSFSQKLKHDIDISVICIISLREAFI